MSRPRPPVSPSAGKGLIPGIAVITIYLTLSNQVVGQSAFSNQFSELEALFNNIDLAQAMALDRIVSINESISTVPARGDLEQHLQMMRSMDMEQMMAMDRSHGATTGMEQGPYQTLETASRIDLMQLLRGRHSAAEAQQALIDNPLPGPAVTAVLLRGRKFERQLFEIYADDNIVRKDQAVDRAVEDYLADSVLAVPALPKPYELMSSHPHADGFRTAFPRLSDLLWSAQWLQLAVLEGLIVEYADSQFAGTVPEIVQRFWNKLGSDSGMSMFPAPVELPMAPTIAPHLYLFHPQAAVIVDNLNMLETVIADILSWPNLQDRQAAIDLALNQFTDHESGFYPAYDYLLAALRGGIYNQGGPAIGDLERSERNRSRSEMQMNHGVSMRPFTGN